MVSLSASRAQAGPASRKGQDGLDDAGDAGGVATGFVRVGPSARSTDGASTGRATGATSLAAGAVPEEPGRGAVPEESAGEVRWAPGLDLS